jgi:hypothetical protein
MEESEFRPVLAVGAHGRRPGITPDGGWVVGGGSLPVGPVGEGIRLQALLPLLERPYREIETAVSQGAPGLPGPPWAELLALALRWPTEYWADRALDWIDGGYAEPGWSEALAGAGQMPGRSQRFRHRAARLSQRD